MSEEAIRPRSNGEVIEAEISWFTSLLDARFRRHGGEASDEPELLEALPPPALDPSDAAYARGVTTTELGAAERLVLILAMLPHLRPQALDPFLIPNSQSGRPFTEFGGAATAGGFRPTHETALFLLAGENMERRLRHLALFEPTAPLLTAGILCPDKTDHAAGPWAPLTVSSGWVDRLMHGAARYGHGFPARTLDTRYEWRDLVPTEGVARRLDDIVAWVENEELLLGKWGLAEYLEPGFRTLFLGPPGTGKIMTAAVLAKRLKTPAQYIDLSRLADRPADTNRQDLKLLLERSAQDRNVIFFERAEFLFGPRGEPHFADFLDRLQEASCISIFACTHEDELPEHFRRKLHSIVEFGLPDAKARLAMWEQATAAWPRETMAGGDLPVIAAAFPVGASMFTNTLRQLAAAAARGQPIDVRTIENVLRRELLDGAGRDLAGNRLSPESKEILVAATQNWGSRLNQ